MKSIGTNLILVSEALESSALGKELECLMLERKPDATERRRNRGSREVSWRVACVSLTCLLEVTSAMMWCGSLGKLGRMHGRCRSFRNIATHDLLFWQLRRIFLKFCGRP